MYIVRLIRFVLVLLALGSVYIAQSIFDQRSVEPLQQISLGNYGIVGDYLPILGQLEVLSPDELISFGLMLAALGSTAFGLLAARLYPNVPRLPDVVSGVQAPHYSRWFLVLWISQLITLMAVGMTFFVSVQISVFDTDTPELQAIWLSSFLFFFCSIFLIDLSTRRITGTENLNRNRGLGYSPLQGNSLATHSSTIHSIPVRPESGWRSLLLLLILAGILFAWQLVEMPVRIDAVVANIGLQSFAILQGESTQLFHPGVTGLPMLAYIPSALSIWLVEDPLLGLRLVGVVTGLLTIFATWLLGCELFRRVPQFGPYGTLLEDDGRWIGFLAAGVVGFGHIVAHFSRLPVFLGPTAWGTLGLWALLRGLRNRDVVALGVSGVLIGLASVLYASGFFYLIITPIWWIGVWLIRRDWLFSKHSVGTRGFAIWLAGIALVLLPFGSVWSRLPDSFASYAQSDLLLTPMTTVRVQTLFFSRGVDALLLENLRLTSLTFNIFPNVGTLFDFTGPFLNQWLAPLFLLGIGVLALNLDRLVGWLVLSALGGGIIWASISLSAPFWPRLLPLLPIIGLIIAFALDRVRVALMQFAGSWLEQTTVYLAIGLVAWGSFQGWLAYYTYAHHQEDLASYVGRAIKETSQNQPFIFLVQPGQEVKNGSSFHFPSQVTLQDLSQDNPVFDVPSSAATVGSKNPIVKFFASDLRSPREIRDLVAGQWPENLPPKSRLLIPPNKGLLDEIKERYGYGKLSFIRNLRSDPMIYVYDLEEADTTAGLFSAKVSQNREPKSQSPYNYQKSHH
ncbi:MAG: hypothetical protein AAF702_40955 [Chloroflexota bacterium]